MKRIIFDMDGVLVDLLPRWLHEYGKLSGEWVHPDTITRYQHEQFVDFPIHFWNALTPALASASPVPGSFAFGYFLGSPKFEVYIATYCHASAPHAASLKRDWLKRWFPDFNLQNFIPLKSSAHKALLAAEYLVEDSEENLDAWSKEHPKGHAFLMQTTYTPSGWTWDELRQALLPETL